MDNEVLVNPLPNSFEDWVNVSSSYARDNFPDWHKEMIGRFASNMAWRNEGAVVTDENVAEAYEDWVSGKSPYSPHYVSTDGYDYDIWDLQERKKLAEGLNSYALENGMEPFMANRFAHNSLKDAGVIVPADYSRILDEWISGDNPASPHHIPLDAENQAERDERRKQLRRKYEHVSDFSFKLFFRKRLTDSESIEKCLMAKPAYKRSPRPTFTKPPVTDIHSD